MAWALTRSSAVESAGRQGDGPQVIERQAMRAYTVVAVQEQGATEILQVDDGGVAGA
jgi:hypothetical protein